jgi:hypothetical protein
MAQMSSNLVQKRDKTKSTNTLSVSSSMRTKSSKQSENNADISSQQTKTSEYQSIKLLLADIKDIIASLEYEAVGVDGNSSIETILDNFSSPIEKLTKLIRNKNKTIIEGN